MKKLSFRALSLSLRIGIAALAMSSSLVHAQVTNRFTAVPLTIGMHIVKAEVASTDAERQQGLMFRKTMGPSEGMVFVFPAPAQVCMWMKNTLLPLSVAFIDDKGEIINIENMKPETLDSHCGEKMVRYALEMNLDWFKKKGIKPGTRIEGLPPIK
jgi:uncharacterized membrane protein (UPF0127 family)